MKNPTLVIVPVFTAFVASAYAFGIYLFSTMIPDMRGELGYTPETVGLISGLAQAGLMAGGLVIGYIWHVIGAGRTLLLTQLAIAICLVLTGFVTGTPALSVLCVILGVCSAFMWVPMTPYVQAFIPPERHGIALGIMGGGTSYGVFLNGLLIPPIIEHYGWRMVWILAGGLSFLLFLIGWQVLRRIKPLDTHAAGTTGRTSARDLLKNRSAIFAIVITFMNGLAFLPFETYLTSLFRDQHGWTMTAATGLWSAIGLGGMAGGIGFGLLADRIGARLALAVANGLLAAACLVTWLSSSLMVVYPALFVFGLAYNGIYGVMAAYVARTMSPATAGLLLGLSYIALGFGSLTGNYSGGLMTGQNGGYFLLYGLVMGLAALNVAFTFALKPDRA